MSSCIYIYLLSDEEEEEEEEEEDAEKKILVDFTYSSLVQNLYAFHLLHNKQYKNILSYSLIHFIEKNEKSLIDSSSCDDQNDWLLLENSEKNKVNENSDETGSKSKILVAEEEEEEEEEENENENENSDLMEMYQCTTSSYDVHRKKVLLNKYFHSEEIISVIITHFRCVHLLPLAIESILNQSYPYIELIVVDDSSYREEEEEEEEQQQQAYKHEHEQYQRIQQFYQKHEYVKFINLTQNVGTYGAKNKGIYESKGKYITFQDSDDISHTHRLLYQYLILHQHERYFDRFLMELKKVDATITFEKQFIKPYGKQESNVFEEYVRVLYNKTSSTNKNKNKNKNKNYKHGNGTTDIGYVASYCGHRRREVANNHRIQTSSIIPAEISLFISKQIFIELLGCFQEVRFAADTEIRKRLDLLGIPVASYSKSLYSCLDCYVSRSNKLFSLTKSISFGLKSKLRQYYASFFQSFHNQCLKRIEENNPSKFNHETSFLCDLDISQMRKTQQDNDESHEEKINVHFCQSLNYQLDSVNTVLYASLINYLQKCYSSQTELEKAKTQLLVKREKK